MNMTRTSITTALAGCLLLTPACDEPNTSNADSGEIAQNDKEANADGGEQPDGEVAKPSDEESGADGGEQPNDEYAGFDDRVVRAAKLAREIEEDPTDAETVLANNDMDREALDSLMFEIARDPDLTGQYRIARGL